MKALAKFLEGDVGCWSAGSTPGLGEPVVVTQGYQGRDGDAVTDCQVTSGDRSA